MLDAHAIIREAEAIVGIADTDAGVRGNLERLIASINRDFPISDAGEQRIHRNLLRDCTNRLEGLKWLRDYPEIADEPIIAPVFLMGLPRSGTTYFQYLFDRDPRFRLIRTWESMMPCPPPGFDPASADDRRAKWAQMRAPTVEGFDALHLIDADGSDECHAFLEQSFGAAGLNNLYRVPDYFDFILDGLDLVETYRIHKRQLQLLQWRREARPWALKYPNHLIATNEILQVYPDARFVMTHRDPVQTLASIAKMTANLRGLCTAEPVDKQEVGRDMLHFIQRHIDRIMAFDAGPNGGRVVHVDYYALLDDPVREMFAIYEGIGIDTPVEVAQSVGAWHAANPKNARGRNDYALAQYGLDDATVAEQFGDYMRRFSIPREHDGLARIGAVA
ncbi:MAG TPA: sulfotransferase [Sphingobium sp.]|uniref:sulfotransferase family protein n=1 Tax=Sphingobium sp. TaxID=1912891 RepID=UPI002ED35ED0